MAAKTLLLPFCMIGILCLVGCANNTEMPTPGTETEIGGTNINVTVSSKNDSFSSLDPGFKLEQFIWDKEQIELNVDSVLIPKAWNENILLGGKTISTTKMIDISELPNYFYEESDDYTALETAYHMNYYAIGVQTDRVRIGNYSSCCLRIESTTYGDNLIVESVQLTGLTNLLEDSGKELKDPRSIDHLGLRS